MISSVVSIPISIGGWLDLLIRIPLPTSILIGLLRS